MTAKNLKDQNSKYQIHFYDYLNGQHNFCKVDAVHYLIQYCAIVVLLVLLSILVYISFFSFYICCYFCCCFLLLFISLYNCIYALLTSLYFLILKSTPNSTFISILIITIICLDLSLVQTKILNT